MKTIPDAIDDIKYFWKKTKDVYFNKRWKNRDIGTGYNRQEDK